MGQAECRRRSRPGGSPRASSFPSRTWGRRRRRGRADRDCDGPGCEGPVVAVNEGLLGPGNDLLGVLRILLGDVCSAVVRLGEFALNVVGDLRGVRGTADRRGRRGGIPCGQQGTHDRLHDGPTKVTLQIGSTRGHADPSDPHRTGERTRGRRASKPDPGTEQSETKAHHPVRGALFPEQQHDEKGEEDAHVSGQQERVGSRGSQRAWLSGGR